MREILFRGKTEKGKWVYGGFCAYKNIRDKEEYTIFNSNNGYPNEVLPETVGQYTGLTDKNGKKIFEGDIVRCISNTDCGKCVVIFEEGEFRLVPDRYYKTYTTGGGYHAIRCFVKEVIGNNHDNPELLKGGEAE